MCTRPVTHPRIPLLMEADGTATAVRWALAYLGCAVPLVKRPAVVFDIDGTILINKPDGSAVCAQHVERLASACRCANVAIFCVTARPERGDNRQHTLRQLKACGVEPDELFLMPAGADYGGYKRKARETIRNRGYRVLLSVGDQFADLSEHAEDLGLADDRTYVGQLGDDFAGFGVKLPSEFR